MQIPASLVEHVLLHVLQVLSKRIKSKNSLKWVEFSTHFLFAIIKLMKEENPLDRIFSVSELCLIIKDTVSEMFYGLKVEGEVCNFRLNQSRHWYFSLKDNDGSILNCTCFAGHNWKERKPENGEVVVLTGSLSFWPKGGSLSFNAESIRLKGEGNLRLEIEKRRAYYKSLGYFDEGNKKPLGDEIKTIGIITSAEGAVIHDIMRVTRRRAPSINLLLFPSLVQGKDADKSIARRIRQANNFMACDILIVCRGGGSEEDLAAYSSSEVIEAIHESAIPVISAVGHDSDFPLSDFVADLRAPTPSAAAEIATESAYKKRLKLLQMNKSLNDEIRAIFLKKEMSLAKVRINPSLIYKKLERYKGIIRQSDALERIIKNRITSINYEIASSEDKIERALLNLIQSASERLRSAKQSLSVDIKELSREKRDEISALSRYVETSIKERMEGNRKALLIASNSVEDLNPMAILSRGYAIVRDESNKIIKSKKSIKKNGIYSVTLKDGSVKVRKAEENI